MADLGKVPGIRKNGEPIIPPLSDIEMLTDDELIQALNEEVTAWARQGLDPMNISHDINALDVQIMTVVRVMIDVLGVSEEDFNRRYRIRMLEKLTELRSNITKAQITHGVKGIIRP